MKRIIIFLQARRSEKHDNKLIESILYSYLMKERHLLTFAVTVLHTNLSSTLISYLSSLFGPLCALYAFYMSSMLDDENLFLHRFLILVSTEETMP